MRFRKFQILTLIALLSINLSAQESDPPKNEFRATWMATVINLDWPASGDLQVRFQKSSLQDRLDDMKEAGINALFFQIRTEGDALYDSDIEPWSRYVTGQEGKAPDPYWDPLEFVIQEAHKRGIELHAWLNPYRAMRTIPNDFTQKLNSQLSEVEYQSLEPFLKRYENEAIHEKSSGTSERDSLHIANKNPEWLLVLNDAIAIMNPGLPEVIDYNVQVVMDVVNRYDVDGIHFDDYFYPYPPNQMASNNNESLDDETFAMYPRGFDNKGDWRRNNIDIFVEALYDSIQQVKPWVKFGISPFGIWKNGTPSGTSGMDAYSVIYGDAIAWLETKTIDYITPQLYWAFSRFGTGQDYGALADWWADQAYEHDLHTYPGHGVYRASSSTFTGTLFGENEIPRQIRHNRNNEKISGSVFFRSSNVTTYSSKGFADSLKNNFYRYPALQPVMAWKDTTAPSSPENLLVQRDSETEYMFNLSWDRPSDEVITKMSSSGHVDTLLKYAIYRVDTSINPDESSEMDVISNLIGITGETSFTDIAPPSDNSHWYFVTTVSRNNVESEPTDAVEGGIVVSTEIIETRPYQLSLEQNFPNPFNPNTEIIFNISEAGFTTLKVYDMLGREVATLVNRDLSSGNHSITFNAAKFSSGIYLYKLSSNGQQVIRKMTLLK